MLKKVSGLGIGTVTVQTTDHPFSKIHAFDRNLEIETKDGSVLIASWDPDQNQYQIVIRKKFHRPWSTNTNSSKE